MFYAGDGFVFDEDPQGEFWHEIIWEDEVLGYVSFQDDRHWEYEHSEFVCVPRDLEWAGIDTFQKDGTSLFKNGEISFDTRTGDFIYARNEAPALGSRYVNAATGWELADCFDIDDQLVVFQCIGV